MPDAPPASPHADDDEFADNSGGVPGGWTEIDFGTNTTPTEDNDGLNLLQTSHAGNSLAGIYKAITSGDFTIVVKLGMSGLALTTSIRAALALLEDATSSTGDIVTLSLFANATDVSVKRTPWTAYNSSSADTVSRSISVDVIPTAIYLCIRRTGTTYSFDFSSDGVGWQQISTGTITFTPTHIGIMIDNLNTGSDAKVNAQFFRVQGSDVGIAGRRLMGDRINVAAA